jgi:hypothetical protein
MFFWPIKNKGAFSSLFLYSSVSFGIIDDVIIRHLSIDGSVIERLDLLVERFDKVDIRHCCLDVFFDGDVCVGRKDLQLEFIRQILSLEFVWWIVVDELNPVERIDSLDEDTVADLRDKSQPLKHRLRNMSRRLLLGGQS